LAGWQRESWEFLEKHDAVVKKELRKGVNAGGKKKRGKGGGGGSEVKEGEK